MTEEQRGHPCADCARRGLSARFEPDEETGDLVCPSCGERISPRRAAYWTWGLVLLGFSAILAIERFVCSP